MFSSKFLLSLETTILAVNNVHWAEGILTKSDSLLQLLLGRRKQRAFRIGYIQHQHNSETKEKNSLKENSFLTDKNFIA